MTYRAYKDLVKVERAFRSMKTVDLKVRPIYHRNADRVWAHVFLCMLAYYMEWHMRRKLAPLLFDDHDRAAAQQQRASVVQPAQRSPAARAKAARKRTADDLPVHSFRSLMSDLGTLVVNEMQLAEGGGTFSLPTQPTPVQSRCFELLGAASDVVTEGTSHLVRNCCIRNDLPTIYLWNFGLAEGKGARREAGSEGSRKQNAGLTNGEIARAVRQTSRRRGNKPTPTSNE